MHGERLGKYQLVQHLATGGMANVYLARISGLGGFERHVVLKTLRRGEGAEDPTLVPMFLDEARLVARLHHQHIAQVYEIGCEDETYFLAMEYVHGETIRHVLDTAADHERKLPLGFGVTVVCAAAAGLHHAHERRGAGGAPLGIVHRDVTPSNVIVSYDGSIKLIDFGIAKAEERAVHTRTGFIKGKVGYMAPEQVRGYAVDRRSDVFALGVLAYELMTQRRAFTGDSQFEALERTVHSDLLPPSAVVPGFPLALEDVIMTALEQDPDDRYPDAATMRSALEQAAITSELPMGEGAVVDVLQRLFGFRPEPWLATAGDHAEDDRTPVRDDTPVVVMPAFTTPRSFARGSGETDRIEDEVEDAVTGRVEREPPPMQAPVPVTWAPPPPSLRLPTYTIRRPERRGHVALLVALLAVAFAAGAIAIILATRGDSTDRAPDRSPVVPMPPPRAVTVPKPAPPAPVPVKAPLVAPVATEITLDVVSDPPGATVVLDGVRLGTAPFTAKLPVRAAMGWLKVRKSDRLPVKIQVSLEHDVTWNVRLPNRAR